MRQVRETAAGRSISAYIILNKKGQEVASVQVYYGNSGRVQVDLWAHGLELQQASASGGGYDKAVAAMRGMVIDGVTLFDHCGKNDKSAKILKDYHAEKITLEQAKVKAEKIGACFANHDRETGKYSSLHIRGGLDRLRPMGYQVLQAI